MLHSESQSSIVCLIVYSIVVSLQLLAHKAKNVLSKPMCITWYDIQWLSEML